MSVRLYYMPINYSDYPDNWSTEIRPRILERDGNRCIFCKVPNYAIIYRPEKGKVDWKHAPEGMEAEALALDGIKFVKIILTTAHLDHDHTNNIDENLGSLCQRCHLKHDIHQHVNNRKYGRRWKENQLAMF